MTQAALASRAYGLRHRKETTGPDAKTKHYQKIERTGRTSKAMAEALAAALDTTVAELQGEAPDDAPAWIDSLERRLSHQLDLGTNPALRAALEQASDIPNPVRHMAIQIAEHLEAVQLGQKSGELAHLVELTGCTEAQLMQPASLHGHWLLISTVNGPRKSTIVLGASEVVYEIRQTATEHAKFMASDATITLREDLPWLHVEVQHPCIPTRRCKFSFVRCRPTPSGLQWVNPSWRDRFWLVEPLQSWAFVNANFVVGFDGHAMQGDVRTLRLLVEKIVDDQPAILVAEVKGELDQLPDDILSNSQREGNSHDLATNWIAAGLWQALAPLLSDWPADRWRVQSGEWIVIGVDPTIRTAEWSGRTPDFGVNYRLRLVEDLDSGSSRPAPWRQSSVEKIAETLRGRLSEEAARTRATTTPRDPAPQG